MSSALHSNNWFRIAKLRPRLGGHVRVDRHRYRGAIWYVVEDRLTGKVHRFNPSAYRVISALDGNRSLQEIWDAMALELHEDSPSQEEIVQLLGQLNEANLIVTEASVDVAEMFARQGRQVRQKLLSRYANPLALRFPLIDPDDFLAALSRRFGRLPGWFWTALWLAVMLPALTVMPAHWRELTENFSDRVLASGNLWILAIAFVVLKSLHELGHGLAVRGRGGEVHEMGLMLLLFYPVPYVDASGASAFPRKVDRIRVGAAGMAVELFVAALAFFVWLHAEPGFVRALAYNMLVVGGVSTVVFNANPLLRYDGYYILADLIEIPNLGQRANAWWHYLLHRHAFGITSARAPAATVGERRWFIGYAPAAYVYRLFVTFSIAWFIGQEYFFVGVLLALWSVGSGVVWPIARGLSRLRADPQVGSRALRVWGVVGGVPLLVIALLFTVPVPHHTRATGVVSLPEDAIVRAGTDGFIRTLAVTPGTEVIAGSLIARSESIELRARQAEQSARVEEAQVRHDAAWGVKPALAGQLEEALHREQAALLRTVAESERLALHAQSGGTLLIDQAQDLPDRHLKKGTPVGYLVGSASPIVKVVVTQQDADRVRLATRSIAVRMPQDFGHELPARLVRAIPKAGRDLPSPAIGQKGGGSFPIDPHDEQGLTTLESVFEFELTLPVSDVPPPLGSRAYVAFEHPNEPIGWRVWRTLRRQFLSHFHV